MIQLCKIQRKDQELFEKNNQNNFNDQDAHKQNNQNQRKDRFDSSIFSDRITGMTIYSSKEVTQNNNLNNKKMYNNIYRQIRAVIIISSTIWAYAFNRAMIASILNSETNNQFEQLFDIRFNYTVAKVILSGVSPLGAVFGTILCSFLIKSYSARQIYFNTCIFSIVFIFVTMFINIWVLYIFRFFIGVTAGIYVALTPSFIKQIVSKDIVSYLGTVSVINQSLGGLMSFAIGLGIYSATQTVHQTWIIMCCLNIIPLVIVIICIRLDIVYESPIYYLRTMRKQQAIKIFQIIYQKQFVSKITKQKQLQIKKFYMNELKHIFKTKFNKKFILFRKDILISIHLPILRKMNGYLIIVLSSAGLLGTIDNSLEKYVPIIFSSVYFFSCFLSNLAVRYLSRRATFQLGTVLAFIFNGTIGLLYQFQVSFASILILKILVVIANGIALGPLVWPYLPQVVPMRVIPLAQSLNWFVDCLTLTLPSLFLKNLKSAAPLFFIFSGWNFLSIFVNHFLIIQTKKKSITQILSQIHKKN